MDITLFLDNDAIKEGDDRKTIEVNGISKTHLKEYMDILTRLSNKKKITFAEHTFLLQYIKKNGSLINIETFTQIVNKTNNSELINLCANIFSKLITLTKLDNGDDGKTIEVLTYDTNRIIKDMLESYDTYKSMKFTNDQENAISNIITFMSNKSEVVYGQYGYAGTGKTTTLVELISYLIMNGYIKSIAFTAPTNKAVNIMKAKMRPNLRDICEKYTGKRYKKNSNVDDVLENLSQVGIKIDFLTIHRLLNYKNDFNIEGDRIFLKSGKSLVDEYDVVIVDECSMISLQITIHIFEDLHKNCEYNKKIIFSGDPAQLPSVNEKNSAIFIKRKDQLSYHFFTQVVSELDKVATMNKMANFRTTKERYEQLTNDIINMRYNVLKEVVRNKIGCVVNLCYNIREWIEGVINAPNLNKFVGTGVTIYRHNPSNAKTESMWFNKFIEYQNAMIDNNISNIILTWTNEQTNRYNNAIRDIMFANKYTINKKNKLDKYEIGDILMLNDFYNFDESCIKCLGGTDTKNKFYTSEQIKVMDKEENKKFVGEFLEQVTPSLIKMKNSNHILTRYKSLVKLLNTKTDRNYNAYKLDVQRLTESQAKDTISESYTIYVCHETSMDQLTADKNISIELIKKFRKEMNQEYTESIRRVDKEIIRPLWRHHNKLFVDQFANVNYGNSHSVHKSQGSSFYNVFVDTDDILNNKNEDEAKRCIYTAFTRSSNELHILV